MTDYVVGFLFSDCGERVTLIEKRRPAWQAGKLNGIGGKIEPGEEPITSMVREFVEETGVETSPDQWGYFARLRGDDFTVYFFSAFSTEAQLRCNTTTDETVRCCWVSSLIGWHPPVTHLIPNLRFLLPLALDRSGIRRPVFLDDLKPETV